MLTKELAKELVIEKSERLILEPGEKEQLMLAIKVLGSTWAIPPEQSEDDDD